MAYIAPIHRPSSIRHALKIRLLSPDEESLVVAKANRLEIYSLVDGGLVLSHTRTLYGKVTMLERLQFAQSPTEQLFVGTDRYMYFTLSWDPESRQLHTQKTYVDQADKASRDSQTQDRCHIDPTRQYMMLQLYDGILTIIPLLSKGKKKKASEAFSLGEPVPARIPEFFVRSSGFLYPRGEIDAPPKIAIVYTDDRDSVCLCFKTLDFSLGGAGEAGSANLVALTARDDLELGASHIIPVPAPAYGLLVLAETSITYFNDVSGQSLTEPLRDPAIFVAWTPVDAQRWLLADDFGQLFLLMLIIEEDEVMGWKLDVIGTTSRATTLVYLGSGLVFVGSHQGDSQVIRIQEQKIQILHNMANIAPILDFTIMDLGIRSGETHSNEYSSGQARIVTGSGAFGDGSLRSIRSGVGFEDQGVLGAMENVLELYPLSSQDEGKQADILAVSFADETRIFQFLADGEVEEKEELMGLSLAQGSLYISNLPNRRLLQVLHSQVRIADLESGMITAEWSTKDGDTITVASANNSRLLISIGGTEMVTIDLTKDLQVTARRVFPEEGQIACIHVPSVCGGICIAGFWHSTSVTIMNVDSLETIQRVVMSEDAAAVPRSLLLTQLVSKESPTLLIAMANGEVVTFAMDTTSYALSARQATILGTQGATFKTLPKGDGLFGVFAICEHSSLIYGSEGRMVYAAVTAEQASCVCSFDSEAYPGAVAMATPSDLKIALVDTERTTHVHTSMVNETVRRIAYSRQLKAFGVGTINREIQDGRERIESRFKLNDEVMFKELDMFALNNDELIESCIRADLRDRSGKLSERFVVGTAYMDHEEEDVVRGRILVFAVGKERNLKLVNKLSVMGACRALGVIDGNIVAALVKTVVIYSVDGPELTKLATYRTSTAPIALSIQGNQIAIGDLMKSVSIVCYAPPTHPGGAHALTEIARHFETTWSTAVAYVDEHTWLESDAEGNLMVLKQNVGGITADDKRILHTISEIRLGEMVNKIQRVEVEESSSAVVLPRAFMGTVDGSVYLFALIAPSKQDLLMRLQQAIAARVPSPGNVPFNTYRAFKNSVRESEEPFRFVDGELIEKFLDCSSSLQESICEEVGVQADVEEIRAMVEELRRIH
ncbi:MAG: hypothetical protein Q9168_001643 [Polycauliona sp. 1 TL-2023]